MALIAIAVVWASYLAVDPALRWTTPDGLPVVDAGYAGSSWTTCLSPATYRDGMRVQFDSRTRRSAASCSGRPYIGPPWYYLPAALLVKTPLGLLVLWPAGAAVMLTVRRLRPAAPYVLLPMAVLFAVALNESRNLGVRYRHRRAGVSRGGRRRGGRGQGAMGEGHDRRVGGLPRGQFAANLSVLSAVFQ